MHTCTDMKTGQGRLKTGQGQESRQNKRGQRQDKYRCEDGARDKIKRGHAYLYRCEDMTRKVKDRARTGIRAEQKRTVMKTGQGIKQRQDMYSCKI